MVQRGRPSKNVTYVADIKPQQENKMADEYLPQVHHIVRYLAKLGATSKEGAFSIADADQYLSEWIEKGYELFSTHFIDQNPDGFGMLYILVRKE